MYNYAISIPDNIILDHECRSALSTSKIRRIEFSCSASTPEEQLTEEIALLKKMQDKGEIIAASIHIPFGQGWEYQSTNEAVRRKAVDKATTFIRNCSCLNSRLFTMHGCMEPVPLEPAERGRCLEAARRSLEELIPVAADHGITLNIEDLPRSCLGNTPEELGQLVEGFPLEQVGICFDVNHLCGAAERLPEAIKTHRDRIRSFHISDYDGVDECHWYPGMGVIDWSAVMDEIRTLPNDNVLLIFEAFSFLKAPAWQDRRVSMELILKSFVRNIFYLENADELQKRIASQEIM